MSSRTKTITACGGTIVLSLGGILAFFVTAHAVPIDQLDLVQPGMTEAEIEALLGAPLHVRNETFGTKVYCYGGFKRWRWCGVDIRFSQNGRVDGGVFHDH